MHRHVCTIGAFFLALALPASPACAARIIIDNLNAANVGFNDPTSAMPVGGNTGTTVGEQRQIAFRFAADHWGQRLGSPVAIRVGAQFSALSCNQTSAVLGSAGPVGVFRDFANALPGVWYPSASANATATADLDTGANDITANFNANIGQSNCLQGAAWYYGLDGKPPAGAIDLASVVIHELGHGLGFITFLNLASGEKLGGFDDNFELNLERHGASPSALRAMTDGQRLAAVVDTGNLHWIGPRTMNAASFLTAGTVVTPPFSQSHVRMYAPNPVEPGSSVSHWDTVLAPDQSMEPNYTGALHTPVLERYAFQDMGWRTVQPRLDFNGEARSGILWRNNSTGDTVVSLLTGPGVRSTPAIQSSTLVVNLPAPWAVAGSAGDGRADILWRNANTGDTVVSLMNGAAISTSILLTRLSSPWTVAGLGDFNGDGRADILWRNGSTGDTVVSFVTGSPTSVAISSSQFVVQLPAPWTVAAVGNLDGDLNRYADILWYNATTGDTVVSAMNRGTILRSDFLTQLAAPWSIAGVADFRGFERNDILWRNSATGAVVISHLATLNSGQTRINDSIFAGNAPTSWSVGAVGHFSNDGTAGILWRDGSGNAAISLTNGIEITSSTYIATLTPVWSVIPANGN